MERLDSIQYKYFKSDFRLLVYICDICNYDCWYCYNKKPRTNKILDLDKLEKFIQIIGKKVNKKISLELIGGEPTLHPKLYDFCKKTRRIKDMDILIYTNLSHDIDLYVHLLQIGVKLFVTWHNLNHVFFEKIALLKNFSNQIDISVMYENKFTEDALDIFSRLQNSFRNICLTLINGDRLSYTKNQLINYDKQRIDSEDYTVTIGNTYISMSEEKIINSKLNSFKMWKCNAGYDYLYINFNGDLYPCQTYMMNKSIPIGNIQNFDFMHLKQQVCKYDFCQCGLDIRKNKVFKRYR